jgi:fluoride exporter
LNPLRTAIRLYAAVGIGSGLGAVARYLCSIGLVAMLGHGFPWGTLAVNVVGSFVIGFYATLTEPDGRIFARPTTRQFVLAGFCGGFTTFSIFSLETLRLAEDGNITLAATNVVASVVIWLLAVWAGFRLAQRLNRLKGA